MGLNGRMPRVNFLADAQPFMRELRAVGGCGRGYFIKRLRAHARSTRATLQNSRPPTSPTARLTLERVSKSRGLLCDRGIRGAPSLSQLVVCEKGCLGAQAGVG